MLNLYGIDDPGQRKHLTDLARDGQDRPCWVVYADLLPAGTGAYLESAAASVHPYHTPAIPGLLQTPATHKPPGRRHPEPGPPPRRAPGPTGKGITCSQARPSAGAGSAPI